MKIGRLTPKSWSHISFSHVLGRAQTSQHDFFGGLSCRVKLYRSILNENWQARDTPLCGHSLGKNLNESKSLTPWNNTREPWEPLGTAPGVWSCWWTKSWGMMLLASFLLVHLMGTIISQILKPNNQDTLKDMPFVPRGKGVSSPFCHHFSGQLTRCFCFRCYREM